MNIEQFYQQYKDRLIGYACAFCHDYEVAQDAVQESFLKSLVNAQAFKDRSEPEMLAWFYTVVRNHLVDMARKNRRMQPNYDWMTAAGACTRDIGEQVAFKIMVKELPDTLVAPVWMRYTLGYNSREIGCALGLKDTTVRSRLAKARELLRKDYLK